MINFFHAAAMFRICVCDPISTRHDEMRQHWGLSQAMKTNNTTTICVVVKEECIYIAVDNCTIVQSDKQIEICLTPVLLMLHC